MVTLISEKYHGAPSFSGRGGGGAQDRARGRHLTADSTSGGGTVRFRPIQPVGGGGGGGGADVSFRPIQSMRCPRAQSVGGWCCPLSANSTSGGAHVCKLLLQGGGGGGGGGHSVPAPPGGRPCSIWR